MIGVFRYLAKKYAIAFLNTVGASLSRADYDRLCLYTAWIKSHERSLVLLSVPLLSDQEKCAVLEKSAKVYALPESFNVLLRLLVEHKRLALLPDCIEQLCVLFEQQHGIQRFVVSSAHDLDVRALATIKDYLERVTHQKIIEDVRVDKRLIAGIRLQSNEYIWEYSVRKQLRTLSSLLAMKGSYGN